VVRKSELSSIKNCFQNALEHAISREKFEKFSGEGHSPSPDQEAYTPTMAVSEGGANAWGKCPITEAITCRGDDEMRI